MTYSQSSTSRQALSLVELLVAIGVVAALVMLSMPVMRGVTERSRQLTCLNQLKDIYATMMNYAVDHQQTFPKAYTSVPYWSNWWDGPLSRYSANGRESFSRSVVCPHNKTTQIVSGTGIKGYPYVVNYNVIRPTAANDPDAHPPTRLALIPKLSEVVLLLDSKNDRDWYIGFYDNTLPNGWGRTAAPHLGQTNILWGDGHVTQSPLSTITNPSLKFQP